jgi:hypothetical protein
MYDLRLLLQDVNRVTPDIVPTRHATVGMVDKDKQTISVEVGASGIEAPTVMVVISVLQPALLISMLVGRALRLRQVSSDSLSFGLLPPDYHLASILGLPLSGQRRVQGLLLANEPDAKAFSEGLVGYLNQTKPA